MTNDGTADVRAQATRRALADLAFEMVEGWEAGFGERPEHPALAVDAERARAAWGEYRRRMAGNPPYFHPRFAGQMLKPPHPVAVAGYLAAMLVNPNNHSLDGGPVTSRMELEVVDELAAMLHLGPRAMGHLTSSGTIANLEALWVARELDPGRAVAFGANAHFTHARMCQVLGVPSIEVGADATGHIDLEEAEAHCRTGQVGTIVLTAGTTGLGSVDHVHEALALRERYGVRLHVDAAYGGLFALLAWDGQAGVLGADARALRAIGSCDSVVVDPHKHGLQPYGCGAVLFSDRSVARLYRHDSPYTYFSSDDLHLGEISLECSRAGAGAAALWLTLRVMPLSATDGIGPLLAAGCRAASALCGRIRADDRLRLHVSPELDIVTYFPWRPGVSAAEVGKASERMLADAMHAESDPVWLSTLKVDPTAFAACHSDISPADAPVTVLRSVLMKPEHELWVDHLADRLGELAARCW